MKLSPYLKIVVVLLEIIAINLKPISLLKEPNWGFLFSLLIEFN